MVESRSDERGAGIEAFELEARALRLAVLGMLGHARRVLEEAMVLVLERREADVDEWEEFEGLALQQRLDIQEQASGLIAEWAGEQRAQLAAEGAVSLARIQQVAVAQSVELRVQGGVLLQARETSLTQLVEPLYDVCYENLRSLGTAFADGDPASARAVVEREGDIRHLSLLASEQLRRRLNSDGKNGLVAWALFLCVKSLKQIGLTTMEAGREFMVSGMPGAVEDLLPTSVSDGPVV
ncbi:MAG: hypothetical protein AAGC74_09850 [Verrucomicrobiota bacterium]